MLINTLLQQSAQCIFESSAEFVHTLKISSIHLDIFTYKCKRWR